MSDSIRQREQEQGERTEEIDDTGRSIAEWITVGVSVAILAGIIGLVSYLHFTGEDAPPDIVVEAHLDRVHEGDGGWYVPVTVRNAGGTTVEDVQVSGELDTGEEEPETADFTIRFLVGGEKAEAAFVFETDPASGELTAKAGSYKVP